LSVPADQAERYPTEDEIAEMVSGVLPECISKDAREAMTEGIKEPIRIGLRNRKMTTGDMKQVKYGIDKLFNESKVIPGEAVGVLAGLSTGEPSTQMALSSHRHAGISSKTTNEGIPRLQELVRASQKQRAISMTIHFNEPKSLLQIREISSLFVLRTLGDFIDRVVLDSSQNLPETQWHADFRAIYNITIPQPDFILRLYLNVQELQRLRLTLEDVVNELRSISEGRSYLYSSNDLGIIDIYDQNPIYNNEVPQYINDQNALLYYLRDVALPKLKKQRISGIEGITEAFPRQLEVSTFIDSWIGNRVAFSGKRARQSGLDITEMIKLLSEAGYQPQAKTQGDVIIVGKAGGDISKLTAQITEDEALKAFNTRWYLETNGSNLAKVLALEIVNSEVTYTSDVTEINTVFGIQAARDFLLDEYIAILSADAYMNPRHLIVLADVMTNLGLLAAATSTGVSRQKIGPLTRSAFEKPVDHFLRAAGFGEGEKIKGVSASIFVGKMAGIGENAFLPVVVEAGVEEDESQGVQEERKDYEVTLLPPPSTLTFQEVPEEAYVQKPDESVQRRFVQKPSMGRATSSTSSRPAVATSSTSARPAPATSSTSARPAPATSSTSSRPAPATSSTSARPAVASAPTSILPSLPPPTSLSLIEVEEDISPVPRSRVLSRSSAPAPLPPPPTSSSSLSLTEVEEDIPPLTRSRGVLPPRR
jgi:DNA-directed RNA polymerase II subunit RPB1